MENGYILLPGMSKYEQDYAISCIGKDVDNDIEIMIYIDG